MKVPLSWLQEFLPLTESVQEIAQRLVNLGIEVEAILGGEASFSDVVVGKVLKAEQHPNADRLRVAVVTDGVAEHQIVCGAPNCRAGIAVAFARIGATLTEKDGKKWTIKKSKIRDVESHGMLCSFDELQLSEGISEGIIELPEHLPLGSPVETHLLDPVFDLSFTPNLGHAQSILGIARELAASYNVRLKTPSYDVSVQGTETFHIECSPLCPRYSCRILHNIQVAPSPPWLQNRLIQCGLRPINNVVDAANYVTLELGQPLHIFDKDTLQGSTLRVIEAPTPLPFETLDHISRDIPMGALLITDTEKPVALAGIMGGANSAATDKTRTILIESASFDRASIRKTSRLLDLKTDASARYDRGIDQENTLLSLSRVSELILDIAGGSACPVVDHYPAPQKPRTITLRPTRVNALLGLALSETEISSLLERLDMTVSPDWRVTIPSYRNDITEEIDLVEEVARLYGYDHIPRVQPIYSAGDLPPSPLFLIENTFRHLLLQEGLQECVTCDLISPEEDLLTREKQIPESSVLRVLHPRSQDWSTLRSSLLPGLLKVAAHNLSHGETNLSLFEIGRVHVGSQEPTCAAILLSGLSRPSHFDRKPLPFDFFDLKGLVENLTSSLSVQFLPSHLHTLHPWRQAQIKVGEVTLGAFGEVHPELAAQFHIDKQLFFAEISLSDYFSLPKSPLRFTPFSVYPSSIRDWTVSVPSSLSYDKLSSFIQAVRPKHLKSFALIDTFSNAEVGENFVNLTLRFVYQSLHETIDANAVQEEHRKLTQSVAEKLANFV